MTILLPAVSIGTIVNLLWRLALFEAFMNPFVMKGILVGSSLGVFASLLGIVDNMARAFILGGICGLCAGLTISRMRKNKPPVD